MWLFYVIFVAASSGSLVAFAQDDGTFMVDGFAFDGPADRPVSARTTTGGRATTTTMTTTTTTSPLVDAQFDACVAACPTTSEYNPVCGSDNKDYNNVGRMSCEASCGGTDITVKYVGRCTTSRIKG